jgi:hypothetical protein
METQQTIGLGGNPRPKDKRDYTPELLGSAVPPPQTFQSPVSTIYMQGTYGTCGAHAGAQIANVLTGIVSSPKYLWKRIKQIDGFGLNDGTDMRSIFKVLQTNGVCELSLMDDSLEQTIQQYSDPGEITPNEDVNAATHKIGAYGFIDNPTVAQIKQSIATYGVVILLVDCGDGWWLPSWGPQNNPLHVGNFVGHHFIAATGYGMILIDGPNSWSTLWGDKGMFNFDSTYIPHVIELGFATLPTATPQFTFNNNLSFGMFNSPDVHALQVRLGMNPAYQTGNFLGKTLFAVMSYQPKNGITPTGFVGPLTRAILNKGL